MHTAPDVRPTIGPYVLGQRLGHGGMGDVYVAARLDGRGDPVALKLLHAHLSLQVPVVEMFLHEARLVARMAHPNVVPILDVGVDEGRYYLAMELVQGVSLAKLISALERSRTQLPNELLAHVAFGLFEGLHHAHELCDENGQPLSIVHRDITPENVLVSLDGAVKVTDFGIAQAVASPHHTAPGRVRGKGEYLAPEQAKGQLVDRRADLFSAASTLAHLATLRSPFYRRGLAASMHAVVADPFPNLLGLRADLDPRFVAALTKATRKNPAERFETARAMREALPDPRRSGAAALGALVQQLCRPALDENIDATRNLQRLTGTREPLALDDAPAPTEFVAVPTRRIRAQSLPVLPKLPKRRMPLLVRTAVAAAAFTFTLGAAAFWFSPGGAEPKPKPDFISVPVVSADEPSVSPAPRKTAHRDVQRARRKSER